MMVKKIKVKLGKKEIAILVLGLGCGLFLAIILHDFFLSSYYILGIAFVLLVLGTAINRKWI